MVTRSQGGSFEELFMGFQIRKRDGIYIAVPLEWSRTGDEAFVSTDLETVRREIRRWWYQVGPESSGHSPV